MKAARIVVKHNRGLGPYLVIKGLHIWNLSNSYTQSYAFSTNQPTPTIAQFLRNTFNALINNRLELYASGILKDALS